MRVVVTEPATEYPLSLASAKDHLRVDGTAENDYITSLIAAATSHVEQYCGRAFSTQDMRLYLDEFTDEVILPFGPVSGIGHAYYYDTAGVLQTLSSDIYYLERFGDPATFNLAPNKAWPATLEKKDAVYINYTVGEYADAPVPPAVVMAIKFLIGQWYESRAAADARNLYEMPNGVAALLSNFRSYSF